MKSIRFLGALIVFLSLSGCSLLHEPSYILGKKIDKSDLSQQRSREEIVNTFGQLSVPCKNTSNICYLYADINRMDVKEAQLVEFVIGEDNKLDHVVYYER